ncbi:DUF6397 family protein [Streptomyces sp. ISL-11]|uniref:DUF6397 family protein n=1 Tax=Streptomyces sp. ISL-11 TaxID=2819174 RepID=UPI001BEB9A1A|nr:DUF6397 family protein [Streptomyces sp. ISL-11]MBT2384519.1 hypothetical protein [Streptomyces sp. ISL-11]
MAVRQCQERGSAVDAVPFTRAARELELKPREFELAVQLGLVRTVAHGPGGRRRVTREEIDRHTAGGGFPGTLRSQVWAVGTAEGAELMGISPARFVRLARAGCFAPARFYVNRYRAVVWHYLAAELVEFAEANPGLLTGRTPPGLRDALEGREDRRARRWRDRRLDRFLASAEDPWERAAVTAAFLGPEQLADAVPDPYEREYVRTLRPELVPLRSDAPAAREVVDRVVLAADPDEITCHRRRLAAALVSAREDRPAPRPRRRPAGGGTVGEGGPVQEVQPAHEVRPGPEPGGLRVWWRRLRRGK